MNHKLICRVRGIWGAYEVYKHLLFINKKRYEYSFIQMTSGLKLYLIHLHALNLCCFFKRLIWHFQTLWICRHHFVIYWFFLKPCVINYFSVSIQTVSTYADIQHTSESLPLRWGIQAAVWYKVNLHFPPRSQVAATSTCGPLSVKKWPTFKEILTNFTKLEEQKRLA